MRTEHPVISQDVASLLASAGADFLWMIGGSASAFGVGAALAAAVLLMLLVTPLPRSARCGLGQTSRTPPAG